MYLFMSCALTVTVIFLLRCEFAKNEYGIHIWKPLSSSLMTLVLLSSLLRGDCARPAYTLWLLSGILLCFGGDMALMFMASSKKAFKIGLVLFLLGHVAYSLTLTVFNGFQRADWVSAVVLFAMGAAVYLYLLPGLGDMKASVLLYVIIISLMVNRAVSAFFGSYFTRAQAWLLACGAVLFYISDVILALAKFRHTWRYGRINLAFYYAGQLLIAMSAGFFCAG
jgi:uncharacterized membrane protein YhhN